MEHISRLFHAKPQSAQRKNKTVSVNGTYFKIVSRKAAKKDEENAGENDCVSIPPEKGTEGID